MSFCLLTFIVSAFSAQAQKVTAHNGTVPGTYNFWLYTPDKSIEDEIEPKPVVIFLHGASLCGRNLDKVKRYGTIDAIEKGRNIDAYVIAPQNPGGSWNPEKIMQIFDWVSNEHNVDYDRVYVIGMSLGGYGTIDLAATYPDRIAAAIAMCGGGTAPDLSALNDLPLWIIHGTADRAVSVQQSDRVVSEMKQADSNTPRLIYNRVQGMNHSRPARLFYLPESYEWLFSHSLKDDGRNVVPAFELSNSLLQNAYTGLKSIKRSGTTTKKRSSHRKRK
ncbi:MAG: dienelactone hydrolase family protein [Paramuribaculum sp.]|nr:dienelactone hydrolase family protein [Paramuribaculum sp.]